MNEAPLTGLRVIDLGRVWSGPLTTRILADFGAEVIKVESLAGRGTDTGPAGRPNTFTEDYPGHQPGAHPWNRSGMFNDLNRHKKSLTLDLSQSEGTAVFKQLVALSDIVVENYTPRVMANFGLDYPVLAKIQPDIIMLSMPAYGLTGPYGEFPGYGNTIEPVAGLTQLTGYPGDRPEPLGMIAGDVLAALHGVSALLTALWQRQQTGHGQYLDLSQAEAQTSIIGEFILGYQLNGKIPPRRGNHHPAQAPHGCYRCRGRDAWVVLAVDSDTAWRRLCGVMGFPELAGESRFADQLSRWQNQDELDAIIQKWTLTGDNYGITAQLQKAGIAAGPVLNGREILADPHLCNRGFVVDIKHPEAGIRPYAGTPLKLSQAPPVNYSPAPLLGEHNEAILSGLLGLSDAKIRQLEREGIIGNRPRDATG